MKRFLSLLVFATFLILPQAAKATAIGDSEFTKVVYIESPSLGPTPSANNSGRDYLSAKPIANGNLWAIPKNVVVTNVFVIVDEAMSGVTQFNVGDADNSSGFIASSSPGGELASSGLHYWDVAYKGAYLKDGTVVANHMFAKFYAATGKFVALSVTGTIVTGRARVIIKGYNVSASGL